MAYSKNKIMQPKISQHQFNILDKLLDGYSLNQVGTKTGYLTKYESGITNFCMENVTYIKRTSVAALKRKKLIELSKRVGMNKWFSISKKGYGLFLSMTNYN